MKSIAEKICEKRKQKGLTQEELAEQSKVHLRTIQRIENNVGEPRGKTLSLICEALQINVEELIDEENNDGDKSIKIKVITAIVNGLFLVALNLVLMLTIGYMTLDSNANLNSRFGGFLLSVFIPFFIVNWTKKMSGLERLIKFGTGFIFYFFFVMAMAGFPRGFVSGLFPCALIFLSVLYFGHVLMKNSNE
jgi:transcriptional regulator with XRE-family HTH domain